MQGDSLCSEKVIHIAGLYSRIYARRYASIHAGIHARVYTRMSPRPGSEAMIITGFSMVKRANSVNFWNLYVLRF